MHKKLVYFIAGWSGFYVMAIELLSGRILAPNFGNSIYVWGGIITIFMLALSLGYLLGGKLSVDAPSLRKLATLLMLAAAATIPVVLLGDIFLNWLFAQMHDPRYGTLAASLGLFFLPAMISGMVSPYAVRLLVHDSQSSGQSAGMLYFISTFGSAAGTLLTSFYLVLYLEVGQIIWLLIGLSLVIGSLAYFVKSQNDA